MDSNIPETGANSSTETKSVFFCPVNPQTIWDLTDAITVITPWLLAAIACIASPAAVVLNAVIIIAMKQRRELQKLSNILLSSLAVTDLLVGAISIPLSVVVAFLISYQVLLEHVCILEAVNLCLMLVTYGASLYHLTFIAWERCVAIRKWMDYKVIVTKSRLKKLAITAWFVSLLTTLPGIVLLEIGVAIEYGFACIMIEMVTKAAALILLIYFYVMVYIGVRKRKLSKIAQVTALLTAKLENKVAKTTGLITAALILSFVPAAVVAILRIFFRVLQKSWVSRLTETVLQLNSVVNPLLYCYRDRRFRMAVLELLWFKKPQATHRADGAVRFVKRAENPVGSLKDVREQHKAEIRTKRLARSASCKQAVVLDYAGELAIKRPMSAPSLAKTDDSLQQQQQQQTSSVLITTATIHAETDGRWQVGSRKPKIHRGDDGQAQTETNRTRLRFASCESAVGSDCTRQWPREMTLQRSMSAPLLGEGSFYDGLQQQQPSSIVTTTTTITVKTSCRYQARKIYPECSKELKLRQFTADRLIRREARSKSLHAGAASFNSANRRESKSVQRPKSAPCSKANKVVPYEESTHPGSTTRH